MMLTRAGFVVVALLSLSAAQPPTDTSAVPYEVTVFTGNVKNAGTNANVYIKFFGRAGETGDILLDHPNYNDFEKGQVDTFEIMAPSVGQLTAIRIRHDNSGNKPGWYVEKINVVNSREMHVFPCNCWLYSGTALSRTLMLVAA
jgi:hypothetical protein